MMTQQTPEKRTVLLKRLWWLGIPIGGLIVFAFVTSNAHPGVSSIPTQAVNIVHQFPHDPTAFSQGLAVEGEVLYEGTGQYGSSQLRRVALNTGQVELQVPLGQKYFGEGITVFGNRIYQLTWKERVCVVYDKRTFKPLGSLRYAGEGWGLADDEKHIFLSDGTSTIRVLDPQTFKVIRRLRVKHGRKLIDNLNELEYVEGEIYANIWYSDQIARIDPKTGAVTGWIDCSNIYPASQRPDREHVLNGIAYEAESKRLFVTGKHWPSLFEIRVEP